LDYSEAKRLHDSARNAGDGKPIANNTRVMKRGDAYAIRFHRTDILTFGKDGSFTVNFNGWDTTTTRERVRRYLPDGYRIWTAPDPAQSTRWKSKSAHLFRYDANAPKRRVRRGRFKSVPEPYTYATWDYRPDPLACVCGHLLNQHMFGGNTLEGPCTGQAYRYHAGSIHRVPCDCPGHLPSQRPTHYVQTGTETVIHHKRKLVGYGMVDEEFPWVDLGSLNDPIIVSKRGAAKKVKGDFQAQGWKRVQKKDAILAWHVIEANGKMRHTGQQVEPGRTYVLPARLYAGKSSNDPQICRYGFHASLDLGDAKRYHNMMSADPSGSPIICRVKLWGKVIDRSVQPVEAIDKICANHREVLWMVRLDRDLLVEWGREWELELDPEKVEALPKLEPGYWRPAEVTEDA